MYARTKGTMTDTQLMQVRVNRLDELLKIVSDEFGSVSEG